MVSVALAFPFASKVMEVGLSEQVADCAGCTEQERVIGLSKAFWWFSVTLEVELWPRLTVAGVGDDAEMEKSAPVVFSRTATALSKPFAVTNSGDRSAFKSTTETEKG